MDLQEMKKEMRNTRPLCRRDFLKLAARISVLFAGLSFISLKGIADAARARKTAKKGKKAAIIDKGAGAGVMLKNGLIVDGTGSAGYQGSLILRNGKIEGIVRGEEAFEGKTIDCTGLVIAPGFIDAHSHMDYYMPIKGHDELRTSFTGQGLTSFVAGNCGFGPGGFRKKSAFMSIIEHRTKEFYSIKWNEMDDYFSHIKKEGMSHNLMSFVGHGTTRTSMRGFDPSPLKPEEMKEMLGLLETAMDQGACGVSLGLQYEPGIFATDDELKQVAMLVKKKNKVLAVHSKAYSALAPGYPISTMKVLVDYITPFQGYTPHNILALQEMLDLARDTGVRLQLSHLIFVGAKTFKNCDDALRRIDEAVKQGVDVSFDTYSYHCGQSHINVFLPSWFLAKVPSVYDDKKMLGKLESELNLVRRFLGFGYDDIQITYANHEELNQYNGLFLTEIAQKRGMDQFENFVDIARRSKGLASVLNHRYSNIGIIESLIKHPASLFMTDALPSTTGVQNPASSGCFARFLQLAREKKLISLEEAVHKSSGASARRFGIRDRGILKEGYAADITVFNWNTVRDNNTVAVTGQTPSGIEAVFINGRQVLSKGRVDSEIKAGEVIV